MIGAMLRRLPEPGLLALAALVAVSATLRFLAALALPVPWIAPDEMVYGLLGQSVYREGELEILGGPTPFVSLVYPVLAGFPLALDDLEHGYTLLKALQAIVMSATAVPVFLWGRHLMAERWALLAAALTVAIPGLAYSGLIMTEVAFYPAVTIAAWAAARALAEPTPARQGLLVAAVALAGLTRLQAVVLVPAFVSAVGLHAVLTRSFAGARRLVPSLGGVALLCVAWGAWQLRHGGPWTRVLGIYAPTGESAYGLGDALQWVAHHAGAAVLLTGVLPICALAVLAAESFSRGERDAGTAAFLAVAVSYTAWLVVEVGVFASRHVLRLAERDLLTLAPLAFLAFGLWLGRGAPRPRLATGIAVFAAAAVVVTIPQRYLWRDEGIPDSFTLAALHQLTAAPVREADVPTYVALAAALGALAFAFVPRRLALALPALLAAALVAASLLANERIADRSRMFRSQLVGDDPRWIDRAADGPVAYVYGGDPYWNGVWSQAFWNRRLVDVLDLGRARVPGPMPQTVLEARPDGRLVGVDGEPVAAAYAAAGTAAAFVGEQVALARQQGTGQEATALWRLRRPARLSHTRHGVQENGDMYGPARLTAYGCGRGFFGVTLIAKGARRVEVKRDGRTYEIVRFSDENDTWAADIPTPPGADGRGTCSLDLVADGFLGSTRFEFVRG